MADHCSRAAHKVICVFKTAQNTFHLIAHEYATTLPAWALNLNKLNELAEAYVVVAVRCCSAAMGDIMWFVWQCQ